MSLTPAQAQKELGICYTTLRKYRVELGGYPLPSGRWRFDAEKIAEIKQGNKTALALARKHGLKP